MICETISQGAKDFISFNCEHRPEDLHLIGSAMGASWVISDENTSKPTELTVSTISRIADFFTSIYSAFLE